MSSQPSICLLMIVRDEAAIIHRCLFSVREHIDHWLIADTGSKDATIAKIKVALKDIPGELISLPWSDFSTVRNKLRELSRGRSDYVLWLDADETIAFSTDQPWLNLNKSGYGVEVKTPRGSWLQWRLARDDCHYCYAGSVCEVVIGPDPIPFLGGIALTHHEDGVRWHDPAKNQRTLLALQSAFLDAPKNPPLVLALADNYAVKGELIEALHYYHKRASMTGDDAQTWYALYQAARMQDELGFGTQQVIQAYYQAYNFRPGKIEPLMRIATRCRREQKLETALAIVETALKTEQVDYNYFFEPDVFFEYSAVHF